jgi:hypothetical protein
MEISFSQLVYDIMKVTAYGNEGNLYEVTSEALATDNNGVLFTIRHAYF